MLRLFTTLTISLLLTSAGFAQYTRQEAYQYLKDNVLGTKGDSCETFGSKTTLTLGTLVICDYDSVYSPSYESWLFSIDINYCAGWYHPVELYFVDVNNLSNYTSTEVNFFVQNLEMDIVERNEIGGEYVHDPDIQPQVIQYPDPDPNLKALIIGSTDPQEMVQYNDLARVYVMLKSLGYSDVRAYLGMRFENERRIPDHDWYYPGNHPNFPSLKYEPSQDLDGDGEDDITGVGTKQNILDAFVELGEEIDEDDRVFVYINGHGGRSLTFRNGPRRLEYSITILSEDGGEPMWEDEIYESLLELSGCAELYVLLDHCKNEAMFWNGFKEKYLDSDNFSHLHMIVASGYDQLTYWDHQVTYILYSYFTYYFTSYILGYYPYIYDPWVGPWNEVWALNTIPYRNGYCLGDGGDLGYQGFHNHDLEQSIDVRYGFRSIDGFCQEDQNSDGVKSFREAYEFAWARIPGSSRMCDNNNNRYHNEGYCTPQDPVYLWEGYNGSSYPENDSSGTVTLTGRGGKANWTWYLDDDHQNLTTNWNALKKYIVTENLIFPQMNNQPSTVIGGEEDQIDFLFKSGKKLIFERDIDQVENVWFTGYSGEAMGAWEGIQVISSDVELKDCEISYAWDGVTLNADEDCELTLDNTEVYGCFSGVKNSGVDYDADLRILNGSNIHNCYYGVDLWYTMYLDIINCCVHNNILDGIYSQSMFWGEIRDTEINNTEDYRGMYFDADNYLAIEHCNIHNNDMHAIGVYGIGNSIDLAAPSNWQDWTTHNQIHHNSDYAIYVGAGATGSTIFLGNGGIGREGWNRIYSNWGGDIYNGLEGTDIIAEWNYWGEVPPNPAHFDGPGGVDYEPSWDGGEGVAPGKSDGNSVIAGELDDAINELKRLFRAGDYEAIPERCLSIIDRNVNLHYSIAALSIWYRALWSLDDEQGVRSRIPEYINRNRRLSALRPYMEFIGTTYDVRSGNFESAVERFNELYEDENLSDDLRLSCLTQLAGIYSNGLNDYRNAADVYDLIIDEYPNSPQAEMAEARLENVRHRIDSQPPVRPDDEEKSVPSSYAVLRAFPNPFNNATHILFSLEESSKVRISIFDLEGRQIGMVFEGIKTAGTHSVSWDASGLSSGVYVCKMQTDGRSLAIKMILLR
ncbi:MAG: T9SS type A sorting domain-containing protein [Candidatus Hatepunaea meridiana]|nr:T9SS type A sorting domain-containing protein [Candidatus Hatepunaea meridiana]